MKELVKLPRYMVEKSANGYMIWDTWKHKYLPDVFEDKLKASEHAKKLETENY
jgi:hypothetical protein